MAAMTIFLILLIARVPYFSIPLPSSLQPQSEGGEAARLVREKVTVASGYWISSILVREAIAKIKKKDPCSLRFKRFVIVAVA